MAGRLPHGEVGPIGSALGALQTLTSGGIATFEHASERVVIDHAPEAEGSSSVAEPGARTFDRVCVVRRSTIQVRSWRLDTGVGECRRGLHLGDAGQVLDNWPADRRPDPIGVTFRRM